MVVTIASASMIAMIDINWMLLTIFNIFIHLSYSDFFNFKKGLFRNKKEADSVL